MTLRFSAIFAGAMLAAVACGQTTGTSTGTVSENASPAAVRAKAPGTVVRAAIARHRAIIGERVLAAAAGNELDGTGLAAGTSSTTTPSSVTDLLGQFLSSGALTSLAGSGALNGLTGTGGITPSGSTPTATDSGLPPEVIQMLTDAGIDPNTVAPSNTGTQKLADQAQTTSPPTTEQPSFAVRWANAMLSTTFTALTVGFASQDAVEFFTRALRPFFVPQSEDASSDDANSDGGSGDSGGDGTDGDGTDGGDSVI